MTEAYLAGLVHRLQPGVTEIYCHPGLYADPELKRWAPRYRRQEELAALLEPAPQGHSGRGRGDGDRFPGNSEPPPAPALNAEAASAMWLRTYSLSKLGSRRTDQVRPSQAT